MITLNQLRSICLLQRTAVLALYVDPLNAAMSEYGIDTLPREQYFLAQVCHESGGLLYVHELASGAAYDGREDLGNTKPEAIRIAAEHGSTPGRWWRGRGGIEVTGYDNILACSIALYGDDRLLHHPELLELPEGFCRSAGWFWKSHYLNVYADNGDFDGCSDVINRGHKTPRIGDANGYQDRLAYLKRTQQVLT